MLRRSLTDGASGEPAPRTGRVDRRGGPAGRRRRGAARAAHPAAPGRARRPVRCARSPPTTPRCAPPTLTVAGWYDAFLQGSLDNHTASRAAGHPAALIVGPWTHDDRTGRTPAHDFGPSADEAALAGGPSLRDRTLTWLTEVLASGASEVEPSAAVLHTGRSVEPAADVHTGGSTAEGAAADPGGQRRPGTACAPADPGGRPTPAPPSALVFVMGADQWRTLDRWPPPAEPTAWYLRAGGALSTVPPRDGEPPAAFRHDPADPVPTVGGALLLTPAHPAGPYDQRAVEARDDVLVHTGEPLAEPLEVMGRVRAVLAVAADAGPADWVVRLCDVAPDGTSRVLTDGVLRTPAAGAREVRVDLWSTAHVFGAGHRLRLHVAASSHPRWDVTGGPPGARTVFRDAARPSRIVLPVTAPVR